MGPTFIVLPNNPFTNSETNSQIGPSFILYLITHSWIGRPIHEWVYHWCSHLKGPKKSTQMRCGFIGLSRNDEVPLKGTWTKRLGEGAIKSWTKSNKSWSSSSSSCLVLSLEALAASCWEHSSSSSASHLVLSPVLFFLFWFSPGSLHGSIGINPFTGRALLFLLFLAWFSPWQHW